MSAFEILDGSPDSTVIIHVPHGGMIIPNDVRGGIVLGDAELANESVIMADIATDQLARDVYARSVIKPWVFINNLSRLVIDPERFLDESETMNAVGMGAVYTRTSDQQTLRLTDAVRDQKLVDEYFKPYSEALSELTSQVLKAHNHVTILDLHSFAPVALPYELHQDDARPSLCLGTDELHTTQALIDQARAAFANFESIAINQPFAGTYVPMAHFGQTTAVQSLMLEIRKDTYAFGDKDSEEFRAVVHSCLDLVERIEKARADTRD
jgi:predicted N-formylglutamate amidohydrolase